MGTDIQFNIQKKGNLSSTGIDCISNVEHAVSYYHWNEDNLVYSHYYDGNTFPEFIWDIFRSKSSKRPNDNEIYVYRLDKEDFKKIDRYLAASYTNAKTQGEKEDVEQLVMYFKDGLMLDFDNYEFWFQYC